jgi:hypothetical protein
VPKIAKIVSVTSKRRRMASVLDAVMESTKALTPASAEAPSVEGVNTKRSAEASMTQDAAEVGPSAPAEAQHYARDLQYPRGSLVYGGDDEDDFLYCLTDNKEIHVCREMADNIGYPKLELGLSVMTKEQLADSLAYNSLKVGTL